MYGLKIAAGVFSFYVTEASLVYPDLVVMCLYSVFVSVTGRFNADTAFCSLSCCYRFVLS